MKKHRRKIRLRCLLFLCLFAACGVVIFLCYDRSSVNDVYAMAEEGFFLDTIPIQGLFLYEETVVAAEEAGTFYPGFRRGNGVAAGEICGEFHRLNDLFSKPVTMVTSPVSGIWSDEIDGLEGILTVDGLTQLHLPRVLDGYDGQLHEDRSFLYRGDACFKVIDNKKDLVFLADIGDVSLTTESVTVIYQGYTLSGTLLEQKHFGDRVFCLISFSPMNEFYESRYAEMDLILDKKKGILVDADAVTTRFGKEGVYLSKRGKLEFCPISVLDRNEDQCLVSGIEVGDLFLCEKS